MCLLLEVFASSTSGLPSHAHRLMWPSLVPGAPLARPNRVSLSSALPLVFPVVPAPAPHCARNTVTSTDCHFDYASDSTGCHTATLVPCLLHLARQHCHFIPVVLLRSFCSSGKARPPASACIADFTIYNILIACFPSMLPLGSPPLHSGTGAVVSQQPPFHNAPCIEGRCYLVARACVTWQARGCSIHLLRQASNLCVRHPKSASVCGDLLAVASQGFRTASALVIRFSTSFTLFPLLHAGRLCSQNNLELQSHSGLLPCCLFKDVALRSNPVALRYITATISPTSRKVWRPC